MSRCSARVRLFVLSVAASALTAGCSGDSECDSCGSDSDCDSGQYCAGTTLGDRCLKDGETSCNVDITQL
jgi:hypothetical protein